MPILILFALILFVLIIMRGLVRFQFKKTFLLTEQEKKFEIQRDIVTKQHKEIEYQKEEIMKSIESAKHIQQSLLPSDDLLKKILKDYFIFYKPRDIVSGDFYWITKKKKRIIIAAADCTGHGVPGAFMSMLGISFLNEIIIREQNLSPNIILNKLRDRVINSLNQSNTEMRNGMDISLAIINEETLQMEFAGAFNSCFVIRNGQLHEIDADNMPIGLLLEKNIDFTRKTFQLEKNDTLYFYSDGFQDQFGGPKGKKLKVKAFRHLLTCIQGKTLNEQGLFLEDYFNQWKGVQNQIDDVMVLGVRV